MSHLLVTNDFPPKVGGIQSYLHELWRRLPPEEFTVLTTAYDGAEAFDAAQPFQIVRSRRSVLLPGPGLVSAVKGLARSTGASLVVVDPALPLGLVGPHLGHPYAVVLHGAEVTLPARLPVARGLLRRVISGASLAICAGGYPKHEAERVAGASMPNSVLVPPGVDTERFVPLEPAERAAVRRRFGLAERAPLVVSASRLVPRKGMDVLIEATARLAPGHPGLELAIVGSGRDRRRLEGVARRSGAPVRFFGRVGDGDLAALDAAADVFAMCCRNRWLGLEQEGFGIVFLEAAATGVPQVAGRSGGADEAVTDGSTGFVVARPRDPAAVAGAIGRLLDDDTLRRRLGEKARERAVAQFSYDEAAKRLGRALVEAGG